MIYFKSRSANTVVVNDGVYDRTVTLSFPEQAHLYELVLTQKLGPSSNNFAQSLCQARNPSSKQMYWVEKLIADATSGPQPALLSGNQGPAMVNYEISKIMDMFNHAKQHLKKPKITLLGNDGHKFRFTLRADQNCIWVYDATAYGITYARLELNGDIYLRRHGHNVKAELDAIIREFAADPQGTAIKHGKLTGNCCFCSLPLSDPRSLNAGYGEICAGHYRLPWGQKAEMSPEADWVVGNAA